MAIYNEYRPLTLEQVRGQDTIKSQLKAMFETGTIPNALLLVGLRGTGKTTVARIIARFVNCENPNADPCNECKTCREILAGNSVDVVELDAASNNKVEDVRAIIDNAQYAPMGKRKVYILDEVHMFSTGAWNALLKILEEPPINVLFILCTTEEHKIPATIVSRCRKLYFERVELSEIVDLMEEICEEKGKAYDKDALLLIARASEGCVRDALSILESFLDVDAVVTETVAKTLGLSSADAIFNILEAIQEGDAMRAVSNLKEVTGRGTSLSGLVKALISAISDALFISQGADIGTVLNTASYKERLAKFAPTIKTDRALDLISELSEVYGSINKTPDAGFLVEASLLKAVQYQSELMQLKERVRNLEEAVKSGVSVVTTTADISSETAEPEEEPEEAIVPPVDTTENLPFEEDEEPDDFSTVGFAGETAEQPEDHKVTVNISTPKEQEKEDAAPVEEPFTVLDGGLEIGEEISLFGSEAPVKPEPKPEEETFTKVKDEMPSLNMSAISGFLWQPRT